MLRLIPPLHRATHRVGLYLAEVEPGLTQGEAHLLAHLHATGGCTVAELHRALAHKRSTRTSLLDRLEARGAAVREPAPADRRSVAVKLTRSGKSLAARVHAALAGYELKVQRRVTSAQLEGYLAVIAALEGSDDGA